MHRVLLVSTFIFLITACTTAPPKYFKEARFKNFGPDYDTISLDLFISDTVATRTKTTTAFDLSAEGQASYIEAAGDKIENVQKALATPIKSKGPKISIDNSRLSFRKKLTFTIATEKMAPADRIIEAKVITQIPKDFEFVDWTAAEVKNTDFKLATVVDTLTKRFKGGSGLGLGDIIGELTDTSIEGEISNVSQTTRDLKFEVVEFLPTLSQQSGEFLLKAPFQQINLAGTYSVDVSMRYTGEPKTIYFTNFTEKDDKSASVSRTSTKYIGSADLYTLDVSMPYVVRRVDHGAKTVKEDDDKVMFTYVDKFIGNEGKIGTSAPQITKSMNLQEANRIHFSAIYVDNAPLKLYLPARDLAPGKEKCVFHENSKILTDFMTWVAIDPDNRIDYKTADESKFRLIHGKTEKLLDKRQLIGKGNVLKYELRRFSVAKNDSFELPNDSIMENCRYFKLLNS